MAKKSIFIRDVDSDLWRQFTGLCKIRDITVGERVNQIIAEELKKANIK